MSFFVVSLKACFFSGTGTVFVFVFARGLVDDPLEDLLDDPPEGLEGLLDGLLVLRAWAPRPALLDAGFELALCLALNERPP